MANSAAFEEECPLPLHNLSLDRTPFNYSSTHVDFSFFYNCSQEPVEYMHTYAISCASNSTFHSFATFHKEVVEYMNHTLLDSCESSADVPLNDHEAVDTLLEMSYTEILKIGFILNWTAQNCSNCVTSGGRCGFNDNGFVCFCSDRTHDKTCDDGTSVVTFSLFSNYLNFQKTVVKISHSLCSSILFVDSHFCSSYLAAMKVDIYKGYMQKFHSSFVSLIYIYIHIF